MLGEITDLSQFINRGFGFITDENGSRRFFHVTNIEGSTDLALGDEVMFEPYLSQHKLAATSVRLIPDIASVKVLTQISLWKREAKLEDMERFFYKTREVDLLETGNKCYVLGRKGTGKTAIADHMLSLSRYDLFSKKLSFKNFPINDLYTLRNERFGDPNQYITLWKYLIYSSIAQLMIDNESIDITLRKELSRIYNPSLQKSLSNNLTEWTGAKFGLSFFGSGTNLEATRTPINSESSWIDKVDALERMLLKNLDNSTYRILFDELDEGYANIRVPERLDDYFNLLTGLFKAVQDVLSIFKDKRFNVRPLIFLREDIYQKFQDSDKAKWEDLVIRLTWNESKVKSMLAHRISRSIDPYGPILSFEQSWNAIFAPRPVLRRGADPQSSFNYLNKAILKRPRDYIVSLLESANCALDLDEKRITPQAIRNSQKEISSYLVEDIIDEMSASLTEAREVLHCLSMLGKPHFRYEDFEAEYNKCYEEGLIKEKRNPKLVLRILYEHSVVGNILTNNRVLFRHNDRSATCSFSKIFTVLYGLCSALNLY